MTRKSPIHHRVSSHTRKGKRVSTYTRGSGSKTSKKIASPIFSLNVENRIKKAAKWFNDRLGSGSWEDRKTEMARKFHLNKEQAELAVKVNAYMSFNKSTEGLFGRSDKPKSQLEKDLEEKLNKLGKRIDKLEEKKYYYHEELQFTLGERTTRKSDVALKNAVKKLEEQIKPLEKEFSQLWNKLQKEKTK